MHTQTKNELVLPSSRKFCTSLSDTQLGIGLLLISAVLFALMGSFVHLAASEDELPSTQLVFMRAVFQGTFVVAAMFLSYEGENHRWLEAHGPFGDNPEVKRVVFARGIVGSFGFVCFYYAISSLPLGDAVAVLSLHPILTVLIAPYVLPNEPFRIVHFVAAIMSVIGTLYIARPQFLFTPIDESIHDLQSHDSMGYLVGCLGSCAASSVFLLMRKAGTLKADTLQLLFSWAVFGMIMPLFIATITMTLSHWHWPKTTKSWWYILGICVFGSIAHFAFNYAGRIAPAGLASIVKSTDILWSYFMQVTIFHQIPSQLTIFGVLLIISALIMLALNKIILKEMKKNSGKETSLVGNKRDSLEDEEKTLLKHGPDFSNSFPDDNDESSDKISFLSRKSNYGSAASLQPIG